MSDDQVFGEGHFTVEAAREKRGVGMKYDTGKLRASLLRDFPLAFTEIAKVLTFGADKYAAHSWQHVPNAIERYTDAGDRHELELNAGNLVDEESGCLHEAQVIVNRLFVLELKLKQERTLNPNRYGE